MEYVDINADLKSVAEKESWKNPCHMFLSLASHFFSSSSLFMVDETCTCKT